MIAQLYGRAAFKDGIAATVKEATATALAQQVEGDTVSFVEVRVYVARADLGFDDTPLTGGVCDMSPGCESCQ